MNESLAIVVADFNAEITLSMIDYAKREAKRQGATIIEIVHVPGVYDIPIVVKHLMGKRAVQGIVALGAVIKGGTDHDDIVARTTAQALMNLSLSHNKPVTLGVIGPGVTYTLAVKRKEGYAVHATDACIKLIQILNTKKKLF